MTSSSPSIGFIVVGTQKSGTTALDEYLRTNSDILLPKEKELHFFYLHKNFVGGMDQNAYHRHFDFDRPHVISGESTPVYIYLESAISRIKRYNPKVKLISLFRNPIERAYSHWNMNVHDGIEDRSFEECIQEEINGSRDHLREGPILYSYIDRGFYTEQVRRLWRHFPKEQTLFFKNEDLSLHPQKTLEQIPSFLGVKPFESQNIVTNEGVYSSPLSKEAKTSLQETYYHEIKQLEKLLQWNLNSWLD